MNFIQILKSKAQLFRCTLKTQVFLLSVVYAFLFFLYNYVFLFSLTAASDPLQYVEPALNPEFGFPYLDRVVLWLWIRAVAVLPISPEEIGGVATLLASSLTLFLVSWFLARRYGLISGVLFAVLYVMSPTILGIASYTYPMQLLVLVLVVTLISMDIASNRNVSFFIGGLGASVLMLCKVQGGAFFVFLFIYGLITFRSNTQLFVEGGYAFLGALLGFISIFSILLFLDGVGITLSLFSKYFSGSAAVQFAGRAEGGVPPFYSYLFEPTAILVIIGVLLPLLGVKSEDKTLRLWSLAGLCQCMGLIGIYFLTQRGGPVISNYFLDTYVIGLACASILIGGLFKGLKNQAFYVVITLFFLGSFLIYLVSLSPNLNSVYTPLYLVKDIGLISQGLIVWVLLLLMGLALVCKKSRVAFFFLIPIFLFIASRVDEGVNDSKYRIKYHTGYHEVAKRLGATDYEGKVVWVSMKLNRSTTKVASRHLEMIYKAFYRNNVHYIFSDIEPEYYDLIVTNRNEIYQNYGIDSYLSLNNSLGINQRVALGDLNSMSNLQFSLGGLVGAGTVKKLLDEDNLSIQLELDSRLSNIAQLDLSDGRLSPISESRVLFVSSEGLNVPKDLNVRMYAQYVLNGKWKRESSLVESNTNVVSLSLLVPKGAKKISYGWIANVKSENLGNVAASVILPNIRYSITGGMKDIFKLRVGKIWEIEKR